MADWLDINQRDPECGRFGDIVRRLERCAAPRQPVVTLRGERVITAQRCAEAFDVSVRAITQNIARNCEKFPERYAVQPTAEERDQLRSPGVIETRRGGGGALPWVLTQKGAIRLAMPMKSPRAMEAADLIVDVFAALSRRHRRARRLRPSRLPAALAPTPPRWKRPRACAAA